MSGRIVTSAMCQRIKVANVAQLNDRLRRMQCVVSVQLIRDLYGSSDDASEGTPSGAEYLVTYTYQWTR